MTAVLVVGLPADDVLVVGVPFGHRPDDALGFLAVGRRVETVVSTASERSRHAVGFCLEDFGALVDEPLRRGRGRRTEYDIDVRLAEHPDYLVEPLEIELPPRRFEAAPGELGHPHHLDTRFDHLLDVGFPPLARPVLGEITDADSGGHGVSAIAVARIRRVSIRSTSPVRSVFSQGPVSV